MPETFADVAKSKYVLLTTFTKDGKPKPVYNAILKRYWWHSWWFYAHSIVRGGIDKVHIGIELKVA